MKATAVAPANIAFIKYWGKTDTENRLPANPSISMNLSACTTTTTVEFSEAFPEDSVSGVSDTDRIGRHLDRIRAVAGRRERARVTTENSFPASAGIASSASGFAALTVAAAGALGLTLGEAEMSAIARQGSGSACRSIPDGFVKWEGETARSLYPPEYWDIRDIIVLVSDKTKQVSSSRGHELAPTSPYFAERLQGVSARIARLEAAMKRKDFRSLGETIEEDCLNMHRVMQTQNPPLYYWTDDTKRIMDVIKKRDVPAYFTVDAGPNVHVLCEGMHEAEVLRLLGSRHPVIVNRPARGARLI